MQISKLGTTLMLALGILGLTDVRGAGTYLKLDYPASTASNELQVAVTYMLWIPEDVKTLRGIIVHQHGAGTTASIEGSTAAYDLHWQALAKKWDCALWGSSYRVLNEKIDISPGASELWFDPRRGSEKTFLKALTDSSTGRLFYQLSKGARFESYCGQYQKIAMSMAEDADRNGNVFQGQTEVAPIGEPLPLSQRRPRGGE